MKKFENRPIERQLILNDSENIKKNLELLKALLTNYTKALKSTDIKDNISKLTTNKKFYAKVSAEIKRKSPSLFTEKKSCEDWKQFVDKISGCKSG